MSRDFSESVLMRHARLYDVAAQEFVDHGFRGASLNRILARAGISKGSAYYHFKDKVDLFTWVLAGYIDRMLGEVSDFRVDTLTRENFWDELSNAYSRLTVLSFDKPYMVGLGRLTWDLPAEVRLSPRIRDKLELYESYMPAMVNKGRDLGLVRRDIPVDLLVQILSGFEQSVDTWLVRTDAAEDQDSEAPEEMTRVVLALLDMARKMLSV